MANKSLTDLTARTATADSDLLHINSGGTDYKETKVNFLNGDFCHAFTNNTLLTTQADALPNKPGVYHGYCAASGHQSELGIPINSAIYVVVKFWVANYGEIDIQDVTNPENAHYVLKKVSGTWDSTWTKCASRADITDMVTYTSLAPILKNGWSLNGASYYGKIGDLGFVQVGIRNGTVNTVGFTLPNGYKPNEALIVPIFTASGVANGYAYFETTGDVTFYSQTYNSGAYFNAIYRRA